MNAPLNINPAEQQALVDNNISLDDKFTLERGRAFMTGTQALIRLTMLQRQADEKAGLNTAGFISGYRGSPLGNVDLTAAKAKNIWPSTISSSIPASTKTWQRPQSGARSR